MPKWSSFITALGTAGPATLQGIYNLGFALRSEIPTALAKYLRVDASQAFSGPERLQGRNNLGLGTVSTQDANAVALTGGSITGITDLAIADGGTGASTATAARSNLGLGNVDNTSDANKPVSTATQTALNLKADAARTISGGGLVTGGGNLTADRTITVTKSSQAQALAGTDDTTAMTPLRVRDAVKIVESGSQALNGSVLDVTGIPAGVRRVTVTLDNVSLTGTANTYIRLGTSGGIVSTGYAGSAWSGGAGVNSVQLSTEFQVLPLGAAAQVGGTLIDLIRMTGNTWRCASAGDLTTAAQTCWCNGRVVLSADLDRIRIFSSNGTDTFDAGTVNLFWEF